MSKINEREFEDSLREEGFSSIFTHRDHPGAYYPDHTHTEVTAHIVLEGYITVTSGGSTVTYRAGDRFDIPANTIHSAKIGSGGCLYMIGEK